MNTNKVIRITDDSEAPVVGDVLGWLDEERVFVLWPNNVLALEWMDELTPYITQPQHLVRPREARFPHD